MTPLERKSTLTLSLILCLRMFGLFAALPVLSLYVSQMKGATPALIGLSIGIYGLTQAFFQIPLGACSDRLGRKKVITFALLLFVAGSILTALSTSITGMIAGRALQGAGAIGSTTMAFLADLTAESCRTKAMAIIGMTVGLSFSAALMAGPAMVPYTGIHGIFWLAAALGIIAILVLHTGIPSSKPLRTTSLSAASLKKMLFFSGLPPFYAGIFILHALFTATFVILPISLQHLAGLPENRQWILFVPVLFTAFVSSILMIVIAEKKSQRHQFYMYAILITGIGETLLWLVPQNLYFAGIGLLLFFTGFSTLEAFIPSSVSKIAPPSHRGMAMGIHSSAQFSGIFFGGLCGGWLYGHYGFSGVYIFCILLVFLWILITHRIKPTRTEHVTLSTT